MLTKLVMPRLMRLKAACKRPSRVRNAAHRAEPMTVPLCNTEKYWKITTMIVLFYMEYWKFWLKIIIFILPSMNNAGYWCPVSLFNVGTTINHTLVAFSNEVYLLKLWALLLHHYDEIWAEKCAQFPFINDPEFYLAAEINAHTHTCTHSCIHTLRITATC